jgi:hypothetical protein
MLLNDGVSDSGARVRVSRVSSYIDRHLFGGGSLFFFLFSLMLQSSLLLLDELLPWIGLVLPSTRVN